MVSEHCEGCMTDLLQLVSKSCHGLTTQQIQQDKRKKHCEIGLEDSIARMGRGSATVVIGVDSIEAVRSTPPAKQYQPHYSALSVI